MQHFAHLGGAELSELFLHPPARIDPGAAPDLVACALGATLYVPGTHPRCAEAVLEGRLPGLTSLVLCLEDAIAEGDLADAEGHCVATVERLTAARREGADTLPLVFIRARSPEQLARFAPALEHVRDGVAGFSLPKFSAVAGARYLAVLGELNAGRAHRWWAMPIIETPDVMHRETRAEALDSLHALLAAHRERVLCIRVGGTDFCGHFGLRRSADLTIYDIAVVRDCLADIVNVFARAERGWVISGPVWEYFSRDTRVLKSLLRQTPFHDEAGNTGDRLRRHIIGRAMDGLLREVLLDQANAFTGKTVIHPSHIAPVHALSAVSHEEHADACAVLAAPGGAFRSSAGDRMNETMPHREWARRTLRRAHVFGVLNEGHNFVSLIDASARAGVLVSAM